MFPGPLIITRPGVEYDLSTLISQTDRGDAAGTYFVDFRFRVTTDGTVDVLKNFEADLPDLATYATPARGGTLYVRCSQNSGTALNVGDATGSWLSLTPSTERSFGLTITTSSQPDLISANVDFELSTDSGGVVVVASKAGIVLNVGRNAP